ncbi:MAG: DNA-processing protein DprA [Burkholderiaceae bacterium]
MQAAERAAWLRLAMTPGLGPAALRQLLARLGLPQDVLAAGYAQLVRHLPESLARELARPASSEIEQAITRTERWLADTPGTALLSLADPEYPSALLDITDPPSLIFARGRLELLQRPALAIVGSRNCTVQGADNAAAFAQSLARGGLTIVSGMALGIDAAAHRGALAGGAASTIAVLGTGADRIYPASHRELAEQICVDGLMITEFPLGTPAIAHNFPRRNRIIAGLARGVLVVEAALRSGSLITARLAGESGREVFAIPGSIHAPLAKGCHRLIKDGAKLVEAGNDILEELRLDPVAVTAPARPCRRASPHATLLEAMGHEPIDLDTLALRLAMDAGTLSAALLELELAQDIERLPGNRYQRLG